MSLLVWLPLNGADLNGRGMLKNNGSLRTYITNSGATVDNNGKIGRCYYFNGSSQYLQLDKTLGYLYSGDFSYAVWLKPMDATRGIILSDYSAGIGSCDVTFELTAALGIRLYWQGSPDIYPSNCTLTQGVWTHVAITRKGNTVKFYINGELRDTYTGTLKNVYSTKAPRIGDDYRGGTSVSYMGYMNDLRVYDHCLTGFEVKQISQALVGHYTLNNGEGAPNLFIATSMTPEERMVNPLSPNDNDFTKYFRYYNGSASNHTFNGNIDTITLASGSNVGISFLRKATDINLDPNSYYTISCEAKCAISGAHLDIGLSYMNNNNEWVWRGGSNPQNFTNTTDWQKFTLTFKPDADTQYIDYCFTVNNTGTFQIKSCKLEKGLVATPWCPNKDDAFQMNSSLEILYFGYNNRTYTGIDTKIEYDSSGYNYNGTQSVVLDATNNISKYSSSSYFSSSKGGIKIPLYQMLGYGSVTDWTFSCWFNKLSAATGWETVLGGSFELDLGHSSYPNHIYLYSWGGSRYEYTLRKWHHLVFVRTSSNSKAYLDGELVLTGTSGSTVSSSGSYFIGAWNSATSQRLSAILSDVKIYATPLSENDVKDLYNSYIHIGNNGNLFAYELKEK